MVVCGSRQPNPTFSNNMISKEHSLLLNGLCGYIRPVTGQGPGPEWVCPGPAVACGFLTSCRKDFTTRVQVTMRLNLLKLGTVKQGRAEHRRSNTRA